MGRLNLDAGHVGVPQIFTSRQSAARQYSHKKGPTMPCAR